MSLIFPRLVWSSLAVALAVGSVQTGVQRWQAAPLVLAAEAYEGQKSETSASVTAPEIASVAALAAAAHTHEAGASSHEHSQAAVAQTMRVAEGAHEREHGAADEWSPENSAERIGWTWVANALHAFSMALLVFAVMGVWRYRRGTALAALPLAGFVAAAGWLSFYLWPTLGLPPELPGMDAAPLQARQLWSVWAIANAAVACALVGFGRAKWRWPLAAVLLAFPFILDAPHLQGDTFVGYSSEAYAALAQMAQQFFWATTWVALSFWLSLGLACGLVFQRWLQPVLMASFASAGLATT